MDDNFWESLRQGFMQLRADCAIDPHLNPAGRLTAIWTADREKKWRLNYHRGKDGNGVIERFTWAAESAAAQLGFKGSEREALSYWLDRIKAKAPEAHIQRIHTVRGIDETEEIYSVEILDICGLSADYCRKCQAEEIRTVKTGGDRTIEGSPFDGPPLSDAITVARIPELPLELQDAFERVKARAELDYAKRGERFPHNPSFSESGFHLPVLIHEVFFEFCSQARRAFFDESWTISQVQRAAEAAWPAICDFYFVRERGAHSEQQKSIHRAALWRTVADDPRWKQHLAELVTPTEKGSSGKPREQTIESLSVSTGPDVQDWQEVEIRFLSDNRVQVTAGAYCESLNYAEFGFEDGRKKV